MWIIMTIMSMYRHQDYPRSLQIQWLNWVREYIDRQSLRETSSTESEVKQNKCSTCDAFVGDSKQYREHFKSDWHKHNLRRKTRQLPPLSAEECLADVEMYDSTEDLKDYSF